MVQNKMPQAWEDGKSGKMLLAHKHDDLNSIPRTVVKKNKIKIKSQSRRWSNRIIREALPTRLRR